MPELPEVTVFKSYLEEHGLNKEILSVEVPEPKILEESGESLEHIVPGTKFKATERIGKQLLVELSSGKYLSFHFGMTGDFAGFETGDQAPRFACCIFYFKDGKALTFVCPRKLGRIGVYGSRDEFVRAKGLGKDALDVDFDEFYELIKVKRGGLKNILMDQSCIAGIGNLYSDEILFQLGVHPKATTKGWYEGGYRKLYDTMVWVLNEVIDAEANHERLPDKFLVPHRKEGAVFEHCPGGVQAIKVGGRTSYYCPGKQSP